jgi:hypothetical protein
MHFNKIKKLIIIFLSHFVKKKIQLYALMQV